MISTESGTSNGTRSTWTTRADRSLPSRSGIGPTVTCEIPGIVRTLSANASSELMTVFAPDDISNSNGICVGGTTATETSPSGSKPRSVASAWETLLTKEQGPENKNHAKGHLQSGQIKGWREFG